MTRQSNKKPATDYGAGHGKLPPQAIEVEEIVLGALIIEGNSIIDVADILSPESFYKEAHIRIYDAISYLFQHSEPIDMATVMDRLKKTEELEVVGGMPYIMALIGKVNSAANIEHHARIIAEAYIKRQLIQITADIQRQAYEDSSDAFQLLDEMEQNMFSLIQSNTKKEYTHIGKEINQSLVEIDTKKNSNTSINGVASGFDKLDQFTAGFQPGELYIFAGRPGSGKSIIATSIARNAAVDFNKPIAMFLLEMSSRQITNRMISAETEIEGEKIRRGSLSSEDWEKLHKRIQRLSSSQILLDDTPSLSILEFRSKCRRMKSQHDIQMVIVDYLQLMSNSVNGKSSGTREQEIAQISRALKNLAKELNIPVIALSQLSRGLEARADKRPQLADLRESGSIEQDADVVVFLYRPEYYGITQDEAGNSLFGVGEVIIAKNRSGSLGTVKLHFSGKYTKFENPDSPNTQSEIKFESPVSLDKPVESFDVGKQSAMFDYQPSDQEPDF